MERKKRMANPINKEIAVLQDKAYSFFDKAQMLYQQAKRSYRQGLETLKEADKLAGVKTNGNGEDAFLDSDVGDIPERPKPVLRKAIIEPLQKAPTLRKTIVEQAKPVLLKKRI
jgi:hypothetical protein